MENLSHAEAPGKNIPPPSIAPCDELFLKALLRTLRYLPRDLAPWLPLDAEGRRYLLNEAGISDLDLRSVMDVAVERRLIVRKLYGGTTAAIALASEVKR